MGNRTRRVALVTDGDERAALAVVRSLGAAKFDVLVVSPSARSLAGVSRFAHRQVQAPSPMHDPARFVEALDNLARTEKVDLLVPITDASLLAVLGSAGRFNKTTIPFASLDRFQRISDKANVLDVARRIGIAVPEQRILSVRGDLAGFDVAHLHYPLVLKPARSVAEGARGRVKLGVSHAANSAELVARVGDYPPEGFPLLLQQRIIGPGIGVFLLVWDGRVVASIGHRRIREAPPGGGVSTYRESVIPSEDLVSQSKRLLDEFDWRGVAMVEFKVESSTGVPYLMEVNGRFWGSLQLAIDAGVDFPFLLARASLDHVTEPANAGRPRVRSRWEWGDASHLLARLRRSAAELALPPGSPTRLRTLADMLSWHRGDRLEVFRVSDPAPFVRETIDWFWGR